MKNAIITSLTDDRPGVLAAIAASLFRSNCNIIQVSQTILGTEFAGIFIVSMPAAMEENQLKEKIEKDLKGENINIHVKPIAKPHENNTKKTSDPFIVTTFGPDQKGLVAAVTACIAKHNANIANLKAVFNGGDDPKDNVMIYEIDISKASNFKALSDDLNKLCDKYGLEINIQHKLIFDKITKI